MFETIRNLSARMFKGLFRRRSSIKIGFYGPPNAGKTSLANRICKDWTGEEIGVVSKIPHETRHVQFKEKVEITYKGRILTFKMVDTPGIATKIDYEDFLRHGIKRSEAKKRAKEGLMSAAIRMTTKQCYRELRGSFPQNTSVYFQNIR